MWARAIAVVLVLATSGRALAEGAGADAVLRAADHYEEGSRAFKARQFEQAASHFEAAFAAVPKALVLRRAIRARDAAQQSERAATLAALAVARYSTDADTENLAREVLAKVAGTLTKIAVRCTAPCLLAVNDAVVVGGIDAHHTLYVKPGHVNLRVSFASGGEAVHGLDARVGEPIELELSPVEEPALAPTPTATPLASAPAPRSEDFIVPEPPVATARAPLTVEVSRVPDAVASEGGAPWFRGRGLFFTALGATAALGGVTVWSGLDTLQNPGKDVVRLACVGQGVDCPEYKLGVQKQSRTNILIGATAGVGVATLLIGAVLTEFSPAAGAHASAWVAPGEAGVLVSGAF